VVSPRHTRTGPHPGSRRSDNHTDNVLAVAVELLVAVRVRRNPAREHSGTNRRIVLPYEINQPPLYILTGLHTGHEPLQCDLGGVATRPRDCLGKRVT